MWAEHGLRATDNTTMVTLMSFSFGKPVARSLSRKESLELQDVSLVFFLISLNVCGEV